MGARVVRDCKCNGGVIEYPESINRYAGAEQILKDDGTRFGICGVCNGIRWYYLNISGRN